MKKNLLTLIILIYSYNLHSQCFTKINTESFGFHTTAQKPDGSVWGWGYGGFGAIGNGTDFNELSPIQILPSTNWQKIKSGSNNTFAIKSDGTLWGSGNNVAGCLGINSFSLYSQVFVQIGTSTNWKDVAPCDFYTIALKSDNTIWGWGQNDGYQMGNGTCCNNQLSPILISAETDWKQIEGSDSRSVFAIKNNGTLWCWGSNLSSMLGGTQLFERMFPTQHNPDTDWKEMSAGYDHMLILKTNNTLWAWENGEYGSCGDTLPVDWARFVPIQIGTSTWKTVSAGNRTSFGIKTDGTLWAWGYNNAGQLGNGNTVDQRLPVQIGTANNWATISAGQQHIMAQKTDGSLWAWGNNDAGQLGNGTTTNELVPTLIPVTGCTLGNDEFGLETSKFSIAPNPSKEEVTIKYSSLSTAPTIEIVSILGKIVGNYNAKTTSGEWNVDTSSLPSGIYIVVMKENNSVVSQKKLVVE